jgi:hypothetical protein
MPMLHAGASAVCPGTPAKTRREERRAQDGARAVISHDFKQLISFPRRVFAPGFCFLASRDPHEGVAERRETYGCLRGIRWACTIGAGQAPSEAPCVPIRGTPASRRSHRGDFGRRGRASPHRHCGRIGHSELPHPGRSARRGAPASRGDGCESPPQDATPHSVLRIVSRARPLMSEAGTFLL